MKKSILLFIVLFIAYNLFSEKWIGRATINNKIDGVKTSTGEVYKSDSLTGACNGFKFGSEIVVISVKTKKAVTIKINDRLQSDSNYFIALSSKAAKEIDLNNDTELVVVEAEFSDINSTERLNINGLVKEGEIDEETLKNFPLINWPNLEKENLTNKNENKNIPNLEKEKMLPNKKENQIKADLDENKNIMQKGNKGIYPEKQEKALPKKLILIAKLNNDLETFEFKGKIIKGTNIPEKKEAVIPTKIQQVVAMNFDKDIFGNIKFKEFIKGISLPVKESNLKIPNKFEKNRIDKDLLDIKITQKFEKEKFKRELVWASKLETNKLYVRFSTTFEKKEGERRLELFNQVFPKVLGLEKDGKYILFVGPINEREIDDVINSIRKFGYKDSYVIKGQ